MKTGCATADFKIKKNKIYCDVFYVQWFEVRGS